MSGGFARRGWEVTGVADGCIACAGTVVGCPRPASNVLGPADLVASAGVLNSGGSEDGGSDPILGLRGVRNGDLNGLFSVFAASFSRRRLACGVDIFGCT